MSRRLRGRMETGQHKTGPLIAQICAEYIRKACNALLKERTEILPSDEAQARIGPSSCGDQEIELTGGD